MKIREIPRVWLFTAIRLLSLSALFFASMLAVDYYFVAHTFCEEGASCAVVAQSDFGQKYGIFLPTLGLLAYSFFFLTSFFFTKTRLRLFKQPLTTFWLPLAIICCAVGAMLFVVVQALEIHAFCWLCMGIDTSAMIMVIPAVLLMLQRRKDLESVECDAGKAAEISRVSILHPAVWCAIYFAVACGPIAYGTTEKTAPEPKNEAGEIVVPEYIQSFYVPGKINVVEISSFECPHCRQLHPELTKLLLTYGERINFTRLTIPLRGHKEACVAYYCAEKQKKASEFAECQFEQPSTETGKILEYARECSINEDAFKACLVDPASLAAVDDILKNIQDTGFEGAPTIWIDQTKIVGYNKKLGMDPYKAALDKKSASVNDATNATRAAHIVTLIGLILGVICLGCGIVASVRRKGEKEIAGKESTEDKSEDQTA
ncbi:MAG: thioredoxin domain-containing protein [Proteobacteria bacterium]|nr:thioredoxin domain-containing protein [Pseudomonadota bacterium]